MRRGIRTNILKRVNANRQRIDEAREREEREAVAICALKKSKPEDNADVVAEMCASVIRVQRID